MKEHTLDLLIVEKNKEHFKIWNDYFSIKYKIQIFHSLESGLKNKKIINKDTIFIIRTSKIKNKLSNNIENKIIYLTDYDFSTTNIKPDKNIYLKKPVNLGKIEKIICEIKNYISDYKEENIKIKKYILIPTDKKLYSNDKIEFIKLTEKEVQILIELGNPKNKSSKKYLLEKVWKYNPNIKTSTVETHIHRLRKKLSSFSQKKLIIKYGRSGYSII